MEENEERIEHYTAAAAPSYLEIILSAKLPLITWVVLASTYAACFYTGDTLLYYSVAGFAWFLPLSVALVVLMARANRVAFPVSIWFPWIVFVIGSSIVSEHANLQRSAMLLCPIAIGVASSTAKVDEKQLTIFLMILRTYTAAIIFLVAALAGLLLTGLLPSSTGLAPQAITALLLGAFFISSYSLGNIKDLGWYVANAMVPIIALTRGPMVVAGLSLPLSFSPLKMQTRFVLLIIVLLAGLALFYSPRVQQKMFFQGQGTIEDLTEENKLRTTGRRHIAELIIIEIYKRPIWGHGANASESFVSRITGGLTHPHNDWLRLLYDYGLVGTVFFVFMIFRQVRHILRFARRTSGATQILFYGCATSFLSFILIMFTDNVILYAAFFGNLQFSILGLAYSAEKHAVYRDVDDEEDEKDE